MPRLLIPSLATVGAWLMLVKRDPSQGLVWFVGVILLIGLTLSVGLPRQHLWLRWAAGRARLAAQGRGAYGPANGERLVADLCTGAQPTPAELFASGRCT